MAKQYAILPAELPLTSYDKPACLLKFFFSSGLGFRGLDVAPDLSKHVIHRRATLPSPFAKNKDGRSRYQTLCSSPVPRMLVEWMGLPGPRVPGMGWRLSKEIGGSPVSPPRPCPTSPCIVLQLSDPSSHFSDTLLLLPANWKNRTVYKLSEDKLQVLTGNVLGCECQQPGLNEPFTSMTKSKWLRYSPPRVERGGMTQSGRGAVKRGADPDPGNIAPPHTDGSDERVAG